LQQANGVELERIFLYIEVAANYFLYRFSPGVSKACLSAKFT